MSPQFYLGLSIAILFLPLGLAIGFNFAAKKDIKQFNEKKYHLLNKVLE